MWMHFEIEHINLGMAGIGEREFFRSWMLDKLSSVVLSEITHITYVQPETESKNFVSPFSEYKAR